MRILSLVAHPRANSFCQAISVRAREALIEDGHTIDHHDLYSEGFEPCLAAAEAYSTGETLEQALKHGEDDIVMRHRFEIARAEGLLIVHPNWWGKPPAILAGWLDRVLVPGVAYCLENAAGLPKGLLSIRKAIVFNTSDTNAEREKSDFGDPLELMWGRCVLPYCGVAEYERRVFSPVAGSSEDQRASWLEEAVSGSRMAFACTN
jgi:putative NADPH-quinone reductase